MLLLITRYLSMVLALMLASHVGITRDSCNLAQEDVKSPIIHTNYRVIRPGNISRV